MFKNTLNLTALLAASSLAQQELEFSERLNARELKKKNIDPESIADYGWFRESNAAYNDKDAAGKIADLWEMLMSDGAETSEQEPQEFMWAEQPEFFTKRSQTTFCQATDEMPWKRNKTTHTQGVVAKVAWIPHESEETEMAGYTGIFADGSENIIMRLSDTVNQTPISEGLMPSMALKFPIKGQKSTNVFAMPSFEPSDSWDFFAEPFRNRVEPFNAVDNPIDVLTTQKKLVEGNRFPFAQGFRDLAKGDQDLTNVVDQKKMKIPYELEFRPMVHFPAEKQDGVQWYEQMRTLKADTTVFEVWALVAPKQLFGYHIKIGEIKLLTDLHTSLQGDKRLFFQHNRIQHDRRYWHQCWRNLEEDLEFDDTDPDQIWGREVPDYWPQDNQAEAKELYIDQIDKYGCPFAWLLGQH